MEITFNTRNEVDFETLINGDTFIDYEYDHGAVLMVVEPMIEVDVTANKKITGGEEFYGYAVDLTTGALIGYNRTDKVVEVEAKLIVEK